MILGEGSGVFAIGFRAQGPAEGFAERRCCGVNLGLGFRV